MSTRVDRRDVAGGEQLGEVLDRDPQRVDGGEQVALVLGVLAGLRDDVDDRRERRDVPDHRHRAVLRMQRQRHLVGVDQRVDRGALGGVDPVAGDAGLLRLADHLGVVRVEEDVALGLVEPLVVGGRGGLEHLVGVVEHQADVAQPADAGLGADGGQADLDPREAEGALLGLAGAVVEVDLLVGAAGDAHPPAAALVLVDQDDAVLLALVDRAARARRGARRVEAVLADPRQVEHEGLLELELHLVGDLLRASGRGGRSRWSRRGRRPSWPTTRSSCSCREISDFGRATGRVLLGRRVGRAWRSRRSRARSTRRSRAAWGWRRSSAAS